jgi:hypothetical protein
LSFLQGEITFCQYIDRRNGISIILKPHEIIEILTFHFTGDESKCYIVSWFRNFLLGFIQRPSAFSEEIWFLVVLSKVKRVHAHTLIGQQSQISKQANDFFAK